MIMRLLFINFYLFHFAIPQQVISLQCPCVLKPGTTECLQYDTRFQATTINEAIQNFQDLTLSDERDKTSYGITDTSSQNETACYELLRGRLAQIGLISNNTPVNGFINVTAGLTCNKYRFSKPDPSVYSYGHNEDDSSSYDDSDYEDKNGGTIDKLENVIKNIRNHIKNGNIRKIWQSSNSIIGKRANISCTAKGIDDGSGYIKLCSACWAWRKLPSNYFPRYVNEVICDDKDNECLSGYATCRAGTRTFQVIRNGSRVASVVTLTSSSYCECKVLSGSALTSLVTGSSGKLPSISQFVSSTPGTTGNPSLFVVDVTNVEVTDIDITSQEIDPGSKPGSNTTSYIKVVSRENSEFYTNNI